MEGYNLFQKNQMKKFPRKVKWKTEVSTFHEQILSRSYGGEKWPNKVKIDEKIRKKYILHLGSNKRWSVFTLHWKINTERGKHP